MKQFSDEELRKKLTPDEYRILREKQTEEPFTGKLLNNKKSGVYKCLVCDSQLFSSKTKFDSGSGWPSFYKVMNNENVELKDDFSYGVHRIEVQCANCKSHLGHLFEDGPNPTGKRYCINSACLRFAAR